LSNSRNVQVCKDRNGLEEWRVEYFDSDGGCYVTIFAGPIAEQRARSYQRALIDGKLAMFAPEAV
jgi:hypothetical protein